MARKPAAQFGMTNLTGALAEAYRLSNESQRPASDTQSASDPFFVIEALEGFRIESVASIRHYHKIIATVFAREA